MSKRNKKHSGRKPRVKNVKKKVHRLTKKGLSDVEIAKELGLKSRQLVRYHRVTYNKKEDN